MSQVSSYPIIRYEAGKANQIEDLVVKEEPLAMVLIHGNAEERMETEWAVSMRTPGHDEELALGYLFSENIIEHPDHVLSIRNCQRNEHGNRILISLHSDVQVNVQNKRQDLFLNSSCGVCGKQTIEQVFHQIPESTIPIQQVNAGFMLKLENLIKEKQPVFRHTGGLHACSLFEINGPLVLQREDVGRHNALDKLIGASLQKGWIKNRESEKYLLHLSGRAGFEMIQKAAMAGIKVVTSIGAPSSLAVDLATKAGITLVGFLREVRFNVYACPENINFKL